MIKEVVFFDTNCYRFLTRTDDHSINANLQEVKQKEQESSSDVHLSYLVASELFTHLSDPPESNSYIECKKALSLAFSHIDRNVEKMLRNSNSEFQNFFYQEIDGKEAERELSLFKAVERLDQSGFADGYIGQNIQVFKQTEQYIRAEKDSWIDAFIGFLKSYDPETDSAQVFADDPDKRKDLLNKFEAGEKSGDLFKEFARALIIYVKNNYNKDIAVSEELISQIIHRYKPLFSLQTRIIKKMCDNGYDLRTRSRENDIIDYLIIANLDPSKTIFVSNETKNLVKFLHGFEFNYCVWSLEEYLDKLGVKLTNLHFR